MSVFLDGTIERKDSNGPSKISAAGEDFYVADLDTESGIVKVGAMICFDREFPESARILMLKGAEIILVPNACPLEINRLSQLRARAYKNMLGIATRDDVLVILGDAGINYCLDESDEALKRELSELEVTLLCIHGNHEERPSEIPSYEEIPWRGGLVYAEPEFPSLLFAKDGEIYELEVCGSKRKKRGAANPRPPAFSCSKSARPAIDRSVENMADYDVIFLGYPI